eukprot:COSAG04_NODE_7649_length_1091_cov_5.162298_2_plen_125_part_01
MELLHPGWHRFSTYMHVCEAADEDSGLEPEWAGVAGRVKVLLGDVKSELLLNVAGLKSELQDDVAAAKDDMRRDVASLSSKLQTQMAKKEDVVALALEMAALKSDIAGLKALLQQLVDSGNPGR